MGQEIVNGYFPLTEPLIEGPATRIMSLRDGTKKMSKSDPSDMSRINLTDTEDDIAKKIRKAKTDPEPLPSEVEGLEGRPEAANLVSIFGALTDNDSSAVLKEYGGKPFSEFKPILAEVAIDAITPITSEMRRLSADPAYIDSVLANGGEQASAIAARTMRDVRDIVGLLA